MNWLLMFLRGFFNILEGSHWSLRISWVFWDSWRILRDFLTFLGILWDLWRISLGFWGILRFWRFFWGIHPAFHGILWDSQQISWGLWRIFDWFHGILHKSFWIPLDCLTPSRILPFNLIRIADSNDPAPTGHRIRPVSLFFHPTWRLWLQFSMKLTDNSE